MDSDEELRDQRLLQEISRITNEYGALHRNAVRDLARTRTELSEAHSVLGTVAHDLRTPLTMILGFAELLLDDPELTAGQRRLGEGVDHAARTVAALAEELVDAVTVGASPLRSVPVDVSSMTRRVLVRHQLLRPPRGVRIVLGSAPAGDAAVIVLGDEAKLERLLDNLVSNALKFSLDGGTVSVSVSVSFDTRYTEVRVRDDGPGLPPEQLEKIFTPFHRAPSAEAVPGVGLGLTIVRQIAERHGGLVHVESVLGAGATFVVRLPLRDDCQT